MKGKRCSLEQGVNGLWPREEKFGLLREWERKEGTGRKVPMKKGEDLQPSVYKNATHPQNKGEKGKASSLILGRSKKRGPTKRESVVHTKKGGRARLSRRKIQSFCFSKKKNQTKGKEKSRSRSTKVTDLR